MENMRETFETKRLIITDACEQDVVFLQRICASWEDKISVEGEAFPTDYIKMCLIEGDLPPTNDATKNNYRLKKVVLKDTNEIIGFFDLYYGFPKKESIYISILIVDSSKQKLHIGREIVERLIEEAKETTYENISLGVQLKNWKALKFWIQLGFDHIIGYYGPTTLKEDSFAMIGLEKSLKE